VGTPPVKAWIALGVGVLTAALFGASFAAGASVRSATASASAGLPKQCPSHSIVAKTLGLTLRTSIVTYTSATYQGGGAASSRAMPAGPRAIQATQKTCLYTYPNAQQSAAEGIIVPVTITFEFPVTRANFTAARHAAAQSVDPVTVHGIGDVAWVVKAPRGDPRGGNSLFVLSGTTEVVVGGPPKATVALMGQLVRGII
jgi:hypothetical protein